MWKISFKGVEPKTVERFNDKVTVVTITAKLKVSKDFVRNMPYSIANWIAKHSNPMVDFNPFKGEFIMRAKRKAIRSDEDKDNPEFAEKLAECKARMQIYKFATLLMCLYSKFYIELLAGKSKDIDPTTAVSKNSICELSDRYYKQWDREYKYWCKLLDKAEHGVSSESIK